MEKPNKYFVWGCLSILVPIALYFFAPRPKTRVLSENISTERTPIQSGQTPIKSGPTASPSATFTPIPSELTPTPIGSGQAKAFTPIISEPKFPIPAPASSAEVSAMIERFSAQYSVDTNVLRHLAICESGFNSSAINGVYVGLFQFSRLLGRI